jgi:hypothetical protein
MPLAITVFGVAKPGAAATLCYAGHLPPATFAFSIARRSLPFLKSCASCAWKLSDPRDRIEAEAADGDRSIGYTVRDGGKAYRPSRSLLTGSTIAPRPWGGMAPTWSGRMGDRDRGHALCESGHTLNRLGRFAV